MPAYLLIDIGLMDIKLIGWNIKLFCSVFVSVVLLHHLVLLALGVLVASAEDVFCFARTFVKYHPFVGNFFLFDFVQI